VTSFTAFRTLLKSPGFTVVAVLTMALRIGANTALFSVVNGVLISPRPCPNPAELVALYGRLWVSKSQFSR